MTVRHLRDSGVIRELSRASYCKTGNESSAQSLTMWPLLTSMKTSAYCYFPQKILKLDYTIQLDFTLPTTADGPTSGKCTQFTCRRTTTSTTRHNIVEQSNRSIQFTASIADFNTSNQMTLKCSWSTTDFNSLPRKQNNVISTICPDLKIHRISCNCWTTSTHQTCVKYFNNIQN